MSTLTDRITEIEAKAAARCTPTLAPPAVDPYPGLNASIAWKMVAVPDPDNDALYLASKLRRAVDLLVAANTLFGESRSILEAERPEVMHAISAFLSGDVQS